MAMAETKFESFVSKTVPKVPGDIIPKDDEFKESKSPLIILRPEQLENPDSLTLDLPHFASMRLTWLTCSDAKKQVAIRSDGTEYYAQQYKIVCNIQPPPEHPNIRRIMGVVLRDTHVDYVLEWTKEGSLEDIIKDKTRVAVLRSSPHVACLLADVLCALDHLHRHHFIHREVTARNVVIVGSTATLVEWGMMRSVDDKSTGIYNHQEGEIENFTIMAPEALVNKTSTSKLDIWAFGLMLYEIYVGMQEDDYPLPSFDEDDLTALAKEGKMVPKPLPETCPDLVKSLAARCFQQDPAKRASASELLETINMWLSDQSDT